MTTLQPFQLKSGAMAKGSGDTPLAKDVSVGSNDFTNGAHYRMPWAVSRDLQPAAITGKELYFSVTDSLLRDVANGGAVRTGFDFELSTFAGVKVPYVIKSYDGVAGTLMGVLNGDLAGSGAATRGFLYFSNPAWTVSKEDPDQTFPNATSVLFLPSGVDRSGAKLDFDADLPTSDKVIVNPGALVDGSQVTGNDIERALTGDCGSFLISFLCQSIPNSVDNSPLTFGSGTGTTVIYLRHCFATPNGPHPTTDITNCWRVGFATGGKETDYETAQDTADQTLQHIVFRRVLGSRPELYVNGVLSSFSFTYEDTGILSSRLDFTNQKLIVGRGSNANNRWWNGYIDCFKFFKDDAKSATWALAEHSNLMDIDGGVIFGSPETVSTSSVWGEAIKVQTDQFTSVDFKADKYSATLGGSISLRSPNPFDNSTIGTLSDRGANNVRYTNKLAQDPDNDCAVHLTNGSGNVIIPVRAHIILTTPPPPSGYYKTPNTFIGDVSTKIPVNVANKAALLTAIANFARGGASDPKPATHYINITGQIDNGAGKGVNINVNAGGTSTDPLVITCAGAGSNTGWGSRPKIKDCAISISSQWVWLYGLWMEMLPTDIGKWNTNGDNNCVILKASNCFVTACRMSASQGISTAVSGASVPSNFSINYNWYELSMQAADATGEATSDYGFRASAGGAGIVQNLLHAYNYYSDHATQLAASKNCRAVIIGNGLGNTVNPVRAVGSDISWNLIDASVSHAMEYKNAPDKVTNNHITGRGNTFAGINTRGSQADGIPPFRPLCAYNRVTSQQWELNARHWDYVSNISSSTMHLYPYMPRVPAQSDKNPISGADGCRIVGHKGDLMLPYTDYEPANYDIGADLGSIANITIAAHVSGTFVDNGGATVAFTGSDPGTATGTHNNLKESAIIKQSAVPSGLTLGTPPTLTSTTTGPGVTGKTWGT